MAFAGRVFGEILYSHIVYYICIYNILLYYNISGANVDMFLMTFLFLY